MDKFIRFDIDHKHTPACLVQADQPDRYLRLPRLSALANSCFRILF